MGVKLPIAAQCLAVGLPAPRREYRFHKTRRWLFDLCWPGWKVALEVEGGVGFSPVYSAKGKRITGHHVHPAGYESDCVKYSEAAILGWRIIRVTPRMVQDGRALDLVERALAV